MKIAVLLSGGVDSSVAALLLKEQGCQVEALTMMVQDQAVVKRASSTARSLQLPHHVLDLRRPFEEKVIEYFARTYARGATPNPCVECNRSIKFGLLLQYALEMGFDRVASGHYAQVEWDPGREQYLLKKGVDLRKDQSYFLYTLKQEQMSRILFPLGSMVKNEVVNLARVHHLAAVESRESQEICFIPGDYREFIKDRVQCQPGEIVDLSGRVLGRHRGLPFYTIGQRKGLGIAAGRPVYVIALDQANNRLVVDDEEHLYKIELVAANNNFILDEEPVEGKKVAARIRNTAREAPAMISRQGDRVKVRFDQPQRAVTCGQSVVYYQDDYVLGGGIITG